ncbi:MAG: SprT family zinc-dependent metalloprotease [Nannocystaceae bacterium]
MPTLQVGATEIPYRIRHSTAAKRKRIIVTPEQVEVVAPDGQDQAQIAEFMHGKRRWVYDKREEMLERTVDHPFPSRFATGGKVLYRGRRLRLVVEVGDVGDVDDVEIEYRNGFYVVVPASLNEADRDVAIARALSTWMKARVQSDVEALARRHTPRLGVEPTSLRVNDQQRLWGSCGGSGAIYLNWHLVFVPKTILEYAVVHELCHLRYRDHSPAFWRMVGTACPNASELHSFLRRLRGWSL